MQTLLPGKYPTPTHTSANCEQTCVKSQDESEANFFDRRYRDVALNIRAVSSHACMLGCDTHMCEVMFFNPLSTTTRSKVLGFRV
jgi:hypothetical protein